MAVLSKEQAAGMMAQLQSASKQLSALSAKKGGAAAPAAGGDQTWSGSRPPDGGGTKEQQAYWNIGGQQIRSDSYENALAYTQKHGGGSSSSTDSGGSSTDSGSTPGDKSLKPGDKGDDVKALQQYLVTHGYLSPEQVGSGEGNYGPQTTAAVAKMQQDLGLQPTSGKGYYGPQTQAAIRQKYQTAHDNLKNGEAPSSASAGIGAVQGAVQAQESTDPVFGAMSGAISPIMGALQQVLNNINNPAVTGVSLQQEYTQMAKEAGLPAMQTEMLNMQRIMSGTEDDIRDEISKSGGTATESQVLAMSGARNKVILKQYNALATNYEAATNNIQSMMQYASNDQSVALQKQNMVASVTESMASFSTQMMTMGMTMQNHASDTTDKIVSKVGYSGLAAQAQGDPKVLSSYEKLLNLAPGALSDPKSLKELETYRQQQLAQSQQKINVTIGSSGLSYSIPSDPSGASGGSLLSATGLSIQGFNYLTQGVSSMSRLPAAQRSAIMNEATQWLNKNGIDISTFQSRYDAYNKVLQGNITRTNSAQIQENELLGTIGNLSSTISESDLGSLKAGNVAKLFAGGQVNDPIVTKYSTYLLSLRNELAGYNAAVRGNIGQNGAPSPDKSDMDEAAQVLTGGIGSGSLRGFEQAVRSQQEKMSVVLQGSVDSANKQVWSLFGVGNKYQSPVSQSAKSGMSDKEFVGSSLSNMGLDYATALSRVPSGQVGVIENSTGKFGSIPSSEYDPSLYTKI